MKLTNNTNLVKSMHDFICLGVCHQNKYMLQYETHLYHQNIQSMIQTAAYFITSLNDSDKHAQIKVCICSHHQPSAHDVLIYFTKLCHVVTAEKKGNEHIETYCMFQMLNKDILCKTSQFLHIGMSKQVNRENIGYLVLLQVKFPKLATKTFKTAKLKCL